MNLQYQEKRIYHFGNMYLSSIQQGIQSAHAQTELALKYGTGGPKNKISGVWYDWAKNHKTMICLNAGYNSNMNKIKELFESNENPYPWAGFHESEDAMGVLLTNVCIILPQEIYETAADIRNDILAVTTNFVFEKNTGLYYRDISGFETKLIEVLNSCRLAR